MNKRWLDRLAIALVVLMLDVPRADGQVAIESAPEGNYLLEVAQGWGRESLLGDLRSKTLGGDDVEVRLWFGFGVTRSDGLILRRTDGRWSARRAIVQPCLVPVPLEIELTPDLREYYRQNAKRDCDGAYRRGRYIDADTLELDDLESDVDMEAAWEGARTVGLLDLPPENELLVIDGFHFVTEVRWGGRYRASVVTFDDTLDSSRTMAVIARILWGPFCRYRNREYHPGCSD